MRREERVMEILGRLDDKYISEALPKNKEYETDIRRSERHRRIFGVIAGTAAAFAVIGAGAFGLHLLNTYGGLKGPDVTEASTAAPSEPAVTSITESGLSDSDAQLAEYLKQVKSDCLDIETDYITTGGLDLYYTLRGEYTDSFYLKTVYGYELQYESPVGSGSWHTYDRDHAWTTMTGYGGDEEITVTAADYHGTCQDKIEFGRDNELAAGHYRVRKPFRAYSTETGAELVVFNAYAEFDITPETPNLLGITMTAENISEYGLVLVITQGNYGSDRYMGRIKSGREYTISVYSVETGWEKVAGVIGDVESYIDVGSTVRETLDWSTFTTLKPGRYRITKTFYDTRPDGGEPYTAVTATAEFELTEADLIGSRESDSDSAPKDMIVVAKPEKKLNLSVNTVLDLDAVTADYTYKLIDDYESDENWQYVKEWVEKTHVGENAAELLELYRSTDYFGYPDYDVQYAGNDVCDYVIRKMFGFTSFVQYNSWEMFIFVKDGKAVGATDIMKRSGLGWIVDGNDLYEVATTENILHIDLLTLEYDWIPIKEGYATIADINDDWLICGNGPLHAYNRHTGEIITPDTGEWNGLYSSLMRLNGDSIEYTKEPGNGYWYDLRTGESGEDPDIYNTPILMVFENDKYRIHSYYNTVAEACPEEFDFSRISVTRKSDGLTKVFDFGELLGGRSGETDGADLNHFFIGDWFITRLNNYGRIAVNFETGESATVNDIIKENKIWSHTVCGDRNLVEFTDDTGTAHLFGEIVFEVTDK